MPPKCKFTKEEVVAAAAGSVFRPVGGLQEPFSLGGRLWGGVYDPCSLAVSSPDEKELRFFQKQKIRRVCRKTQVLRQTLIAYSPLYFLRVAMPPRMCRCCLFTSSTWRT